MSGLTVDTSEGLPEIIPPQQGQVSLCLSSWPIFLGRPPTLIWAIAGDCAPHLVVPASSHAEPDAGVRRAVGGDDAGDDEECGQQQRP